MTEHANHAIDWTLANWETVALGALVALQAVNKLTLRWDEGQKSRLTRALLVLTELLSVLTSKGWRTPLGALKLPLTLRSGTRGSIFPPPPVSMLLMIGGLAIMPTLCGCASSATWRADADKAISVAHDTAKAGWAAARAILHNRCMEAGKACVARSYAGEMEDCEDVKQCRATRANYTTAYQGCQEMIALAGEALHQYDMAANAYKDNQELSSQDDEIARELAAKKAETQERIDRAKRATLGLMRKLGEEGLTNDAGRSGGNGDY